MKTQKTSDYLKYTFSKAEAEENAQSLARANQQLAELELKKKQLAADIKSEIEASNSTIAKYARFVRDGYDFRMIDCEIQMNTPSDGLKQTVRLDTGEIIREVAMSDQEKQGNLDLREL